MTLKNRILWSELAKISFIEILDFLKVTWGEKQIQSFYDLTNDTIKAIINNPLHFPVYQKEKNIRRALVHKNVSLFYSFDKSSHLIILRVFFDNRKRPIHL